MYSLVDVLEKRTMCALRCSFRECEAHNLRGAGVLGCNSFHLALSLTSSILGMTILTNMECLYHRQKSKDSWECERKIIAILVLQLAKSNKCLTFYLCAFAVWVGDKCNFRKTHKSRMSKNPHNSVERAWCDTTLDFKIALHQQY